MVEGCVLVFDFKSARDAVTRHAVFAFLDRLVEAWARQATVMSKALDNAGEQQGSEERGAPSCSFCAIPYKRISAEASGASVSQGTATGSDPNQVCGTR